MTTHPTRVTCLGGKYFFDDDQQFPDTQYAVCEYEPGPSGQPRQLICERRPDGIGLESARFKEKLLTAGREKIPRTDRMGVDLRSDGAQCAFGY